MTVAEGPIVLDYEFNKAAPQIWEALVVPDQMASWYFENIPDFKAEVGFGTSFPVRSEERTFTHLWEVTEVIPGKEITHTWEFEEYPGKALLTFSLQPSGDLVQLKVTTHVSEDFPEDIPEFARESCIQGWNYFIDQRLREYLSRED